MIALPSSEDIDPSSTNFETRRGGDEWQTRLEDRAPFLVACALLIILIAVYGSLRKNVFTLEELNLDTAAAMTLLLAATGQTIVLLRGGIDLSIGGMISLGTVLAATRFGGNSTTGSVLLRIHRHDRPGGRGGEWLDRRSPETSAILGYAGDSVDPLRSRANHIANGRRKFSGWMDEVWCSLFSGIVQFSLAADRTCAILGLVPQDPACRCDSRRRFEPAVSLPFRRFANSPRRCDL